jgi:glyoxylase-like metal-dependent hydrolase (beta-lactamase superfamily II)
MEGNGLCIGSNLSRRSFLNHASQLSALIAAYPLIPLPNLAESLAADTRIAQTLVVDKGFASVRKVGDGLYATISDASKGLQTICNGGFLYGKDAAVLIEGFVSPAGAAFQHETMRSLSKAPIMGAIETHYHFDHSMGNAFYGANGIALWAHAATARRIWETYAAMQGADRSVVIGPLEAKAKAAKTEAAQQHAAQYAANIGNIFSTANNTVIAIPNHPLDAAKLPVKLDLGGVVAQVETYPGHSGTDIIVRVPQQNVVYTGDLLFSNMYPVTFDEQATVAGWRETLKTFLSW